MGRRFILNGQESINQWKYFDRILELKNIKSCIFLIQLHRELLYNIYIFKCKKKKYISTSKIAGTLSKRKKVINNLVKIYNLLLKIISDLIFYLKI
jgi:hypothetical protein